MAARVAQGLVDEAVAKLGLSRRFELRELCLRARSSFVFTSARSKSRRTVFAASPAELLYEYVALEPVPLTTICGFFRADVHHVVHFSSGTMPITASRTSPIVIGRPKLCRMRAKNCCGDAFASSRILS